MTIDTQKSVLVALVQQYVSFDFHKKGRVPSGGENFFFFQSMALFTFLKSRLRIKKWFIKILTLEKLSLNNSKSADFAKTSKIVSLLRIALAMIKIFKNRFLKIL